MDSRIFSSLALVCALAILYPALNHASKEIAAISDEFNAEDFTLDMLANLETDEQDNPSSESPIQKKSYPMDSEEDDSEDSDEEDTEETPSSQSPQPLSQAGSAPLTPIQPLSKSQSSTETPAHIFSIGGNYAYAHLKVEGTPSFHGNLGGAQAMYEYRPQNGFYAGVDALWRQGTVDSHLANRFLIEADAQERFGYTTSCCENKWMWSFFAGFGYHYMGHHLKQEGQPSMRFNYNEFYVPIGLFTDYRPNSWFSWGLRATWMPQIYPTVTIIPIQGARWKTACTFGNVVAQLPLKFSIGKKRSFFVTLKPTFTYWKDGKTTAKTTSGEGLNLPSNAYYFWGCNLDVGYAF